MHTQLTSSISLKPHGERDRSRDRDGRWKTERKSERKERSFRGDVLHYLGFSKRKKMFPDTLPLWLRSEIWSIHCFLTKRARSLLFSLNMAVRIKDVILRLQKQNCFKATEKQILSLGPARFA